MNIENFRLNNILIEEGRKTDLYLFIVESDKDFENDFKYKDLFFEQVYSMLTDHQKITCHLKVEISKAIDDLKDGEFITHKLRTIGVKYKLSLKAVERHYRFVKRID